MVTGHQRPHLVVRYVAANGFQVRFDVQAPSNGPTFQFRPKFVPLLRHARNVSPLVVEEQGSGLNQALNQQHLFDWGFPSFEKVPQRFPRFVSMPKLSVIEQVQALLEKSRLFGTKRTGVQCHVVGRRDWTLKQFVSPSPAPHSSRGG